MAGVQTVNAGPLTALDVSSSGEMMCFGDADGGLSLWADRSRTCGEKTGEGGERERGENGLVENMGKGGEWEMGERGENG